jgi:hypothetical protein
LLRLPILIASTQITRLPGGGDLAQTRLAATIAFFAGGFFMIRRLMFAACAAALWSLVPVEECQAQQAYGRQWGRTYNTQDWNRFYHYPFVYYPQNFWSADYYRSSEDLYYRYPQEMRVPVYNNSWHNYYPEPRKYHRGHHFLTDTF